MTDPAQAFSFGQTGHSGSPDTGGPTCSACHSGASGASISVSGPTQVQAGSSADYVITLSGGPAEIGGFNAAFGAQAGTISPSGNMQLRNGEATHLDAELFDGGPLSWTFTWTAPTQGGPVTLYVAGVSANESFDTTGDSVATTTLSIDVAAPEPTPTPEPSPTPGAGSGTNDPEPVVEDGDAAGAADDDASDGGASLINTIDREAAKSDSESENNTAEPFVVGDVPTLFGFGLAPQAETSQAPADASEPSSTPVSAVPFFTG